MKDIDVCHFIKQLQRWPASPWAPSDLRSWIHNPGPKSSSHERKRHTTDTTSPSSIASNLKLWTHPTSSEWGFQTMTRAQLSCPVKVSLSALCELPPSGEFHPGSHVPLQRDSCELLESSPSGSPRNLPFFDSGYLTRTDAHSGRLPAKKKKSIVNISMLALFEPEFGTEKHCDSSMSPSVKRIRVAKLIGSLRLTVPARPEGPQAAHMTLWEQAFGSNLLQNPNHPQRPSCSCP